MSSESAKMVDHGSLFFYIPTKACHEFNTRQSPSFSLFVLKCASPFALQDTLWGKSLWPSRGWPGTGPKTDVSPPSTTPPSSSQVGSYVAGMSVQGGVAGLGVGAGTWALGWDVDEGSAEDPIPLLDSVTSRVRVKSFWRLGFGRVTFEAF